MDDCNADRDPLAVLLEEAGFTSYPRGPGIHAVLFSGALRPWGVDVRISQDWVCFRAHIMALPKAESARNALLDTVTRANDRFSWVKFSVAWTDQLVLDAQHLTQHVDAQALFKLVWLVESVAEREYPRLLDIARSSEALDDLQVAYKRSPAA